MNKGQLIELLGGRHTAAFARSRWAERRQHPAEPLSGESRWEVPDSDTQEPGRYAMRDEDAAEHLTSKKFEDALTNLGRSCKSQPVGTPTSSGK
jgi:hypothetical protein